MNLPIPPLLLEVIADCMMPSDSGLNSGRAVLEYMLEGKFAPTIGASLYPSKFAGGIALAIITNLKRLKFTFLIILLEKDG